MGSPEHIKLLYYFGSDQVYDFWLIQPKVILIYPVTGKFRNVIIRTFTGWCLA